MKTSAVKLLVVKLSVLAGLCLAAAPAARAQDGLQIAAGVLQGIANGLGGGMNNGGFPNNGGGFPNGGFPNGGFPNGGFPNGGFPNNGGWPNNHGGFQPGMPRYDAWGNSTTIHGSHLQPGAQVAIPGTVHQWQNGNAGGVRYQGIDGQWHGHTTIQNPNGTRSNHSYALPQQYKPVQSTGTAPSGQGFTYQRPYTR